MVLGSLLSQANSWAAAGQRGGVRRGSVVAAAAVRVAAIRVTPLRTSTPRRPTPVPLASFAAAPTRSSDGEDDPLGAAPGRGDTSSAVVPPPSAAAPPPPPPSLPPPPQYGDAHGWVAAATVLESVLDSVDLSDWDASPSDAAPPALPFVLPGAPVLRGLPVAPGWTDAVAAALMPATVPSVPAAPAGISASGRAWLRCQWPFSELGAEAFDAISELLEPRPVMPGELLQTAGGPASEFFVISAGSLEATAAPGQEVLVFRSVGVQVRGLSSSDGGTDYALDCLPGGLDNNTVRGRNGAGNKASAISGGCGKPGGYETGSFTAGPGAAFNWSEAILDAPAAATIRVGSAPGEIWAVPADALRRLAARRPRAVLEVGQRLSQRLVQDLGDASAAFVDEERRRRFLEPFLVGRPKVGVVGNSKYADRLRKQVVAAAHDARRGPVLVLGEVGMCPEHTASLIHFGSTARHGPIAELDCASMKEEALLTKVFGRGTIPGLLHWLGKDGTLLFSNVHRAPPGLIVRLQQLLQHGTYRPLTPTAAAGSCRPPVPPAERQAGARILLASETAIPALDGLASVITVPPLRLRPADAVALQRFYVRRASKQADGTRMELTPEAERKIKAYSFPAGKTELEAAVLRAVSETRRLNTSASAPAAKAPNGKSPAATITSAAKAGKSATTTQAAAAAAPSAETYSKPAAVATAAALPPVPLDSDAFWGLSQGQDRMKIDLLTTFPWLRDFVRSSAFPEGLNHGFTKWAFGAMLAGLLLGPQDRDHNVFLSLVWNWWWPGIFVVYPFLGRVWCSVCPFMIWGEVAQRWRTSQGAKLLKWPKDEIETVGPWFAFALFAGILVWEEVWNLPNSAALTAALLGLITAGAVAGSSFFEKRMWCRYLCPIGLQNGLFAKASMTEVRARQGVCAGSCSTYACIKGGCGSTGCDSSDGSEDEGLATDGCPLQYHSAKLPDNSSCVMCMNCVKACPNRSVEVRLRPPGLDLWTTHVPRAAEASLLMMLMGAAYLRRLDPLLDSLNLQTTDIMASRPAHIAASAAVLAAPGAIAWAVDTAGRWLLRRREAAATAADDDNASAAATADSGVSLTPPFLSLCYGYVPLVWAATLATYEDGLMGEGGAVLRTLGRTVGMSEVASAHLPGIVASSGAIEFVQGATLIAGAGLSLALTRKLAGRGWREAVPQAVTILGLCWGLWQVVFPQGPII